MFWAKPAHSTGRPPAYFFPFWSWPPFSSFFEKFLLFPTFLSLSTCTGGRPVSILADLWGEPMGHPQLSCGF